MRHISQFASIATFGLSRLNDNVTIAASFIDGSIAILTVTHSVTDSEAAPRTIITSIYNGTDSGANVTPLHALIAVLCPIIATSAERANLNLIGYLHDPDLLAHAANLNDADTLHGGFRVFNLPSYTGYDRTVTHGHTIVTDIALRDIRDLYLAGNYQSSFVIEPTELSGERTMHLTQLAMHNYIHVAACDSHAGNNDAVCIELRDAIFPAFEALATRLPD